MAVLQDLINVAEPSSATGNDEITNIITEEAEAFFKGQKSVSDVANVIQSRVQVYVNETDKERLDYREQAAGGSEAEAASQIG